MSRSKRTVISIAWMALVIALGMAVLFAATSHAAHPFPVTLKGYDGSNIAPESPQPYSPKLSCSNANGIAACHDYNSVTNGYHFQQGRTDASGQITVSDTFSPVKPWILSNGMFGKW